MEIPSVSLKPQSALAPHDKMNSHVQNMIASRATLLKQWPPDQPLPTTIKNDSYMATLVYFASILDVHAKTNKPPRRTNNTRTHRQGRGGGRGRGLLHSAFLVWKISGWNQVDKFPHPKHLLFSLQVPR